MRSYKVVIELAIRRYVKLYKKDVIREVFSTLDTGAEVNVINPSLPIKLGLEKLDV